MYVNSRIREDINNTSNKNLFCSTGSKEKTVVMICNSDYFENIIINWFLLISSMCVCVCVCVCVYVCVFVCMCVCVLFLFQI